MSGRFVLDCKRPDGSRPSVRVAINVPAYGLVPSGFAWDYGNMLVVSTARLVMPGHLELVMNIHEQTYIEENRASLVDQAREHGCTHALWLDTDMRFPPDTLIRLLKHEEAIVGVVYPQRRSPYMPTAFKSVARREYCYSTPDSTGLEEVESVGMGVMLTDLTVFRTLSRPQFGDRFCGDRRIRDDVAFCVSAREAGYRVFVDHDLSKEIRHIGTQEISNASVEAPCLTT